ncbi:amidohydrolase [Sinomonas atrocyanea]|uniref:Amidohydrolase n=3 Tax=Sinomonas atrocyanea TaxID=37927 RepID=A0A127A4X6_9MICC|nr:amidohydrolase [Sinomonas atrocyanea]GEB65538.1 amidohydrolase [Sinomonas atrocyanea]GGG71267.1 amidohydrolase [Sinomonas atrocyanea]
MPKRPVAVAEADLAIVNAQVLTMDRGRGSNRIPADAVAVGGGRILAVGSRDVAALTGPRTRRIDARGGAVLPGINDAHLHLVGASMAAFGYLDVSAPIAPGWDAVARRLEGAEPGEDGWVRARGWDDVLIGPAAGQILDVRPDTPVVAFDSTGHQLVANREALRRAGLAASTPDPAGGVIVRGEGGEPTGLFQDAAMEIVNRALPPVPAATLRKAVLAMQRRLHTQGITSLTEPGLGPASAGLLDGSGSVEAIRLLGDLAVSGELMLRVAVLMLFAGTGGADSAAIGAGLASRLRHAYTDRGIAPERLRIAGVKVFADGIPRSGTAWMAEPYGDHCTRGSLVIAGATEQDRVEELRHILRLVDRAGLQAGIHATGDAATEAAADALAAATDPGRRHYIIHGAFSTPETTLARMAQHGIGYSTNPLIRHGAGDAMRRLLGEERFARHQPLRTAATAGVPFTLASDAPVASTDWRETIVAAVRRGTRTSPGIPGDPEGISGLEALAAMTADAAWQDHAEQFKGTIAPGMAADLCVLAGQWPDDDRIEELLETDVALTIADGVPAREHAPR